MRELSERMSYTELMEWFAYYNVEPWGSELQGKRMALNTAQILNAGLMMADPKRLRSKPFRDEDFYLGVYKPLIKEQNWKDQYNILMALAKPKPKKDVKK